MKAIVLKVFVLVAMFFFVGLAARAQDITAKSIEPIKEIQQIKVDQRVELKAVLVQKSVQKQEMQQYIDRRTNSPQVRQLEKLQPAKLK
jgi:hypothetical protein